MTSRRAAQFRAVGVAALAALAVAAVGGTVTVIGPWYHHLAKPAWQPPDPAFGLIWTIIFAFCAASGATAWRDAPSRATREWLIGLFAFNGFLNVLWSLLFFRLQRPDWAFVEDTAFWLSILLLILFQARFSRLAAWFLAPYLLWVSIATVLNFEIIRLNGPFG